MIRTMHIFLSCFCRYETIPIIIKASVLVPSLICWVGGASRGFIDGEKRPILSYQFGQRPVILMSHTGGQTRSGLKPTPGLLIDL